jgi:DUF4097 and DUF4098 domain-containing protein YvlB
MTRHSRFVIVPLAVSLLALTGCWNVGLNAFTAEDVVHKEFAVTKAPRVVIETFNGSVNVATHPESKVVASVTKRASGASQEEAEKDLDKIDVSLAQEEGVVHVSARTERQVWTNRGASVDMQVPAGSVLEVRTSNGKVSVLGPTGAVTAESSNAGMEVKGSNGELQLTTSNGPVRAEGGTRAVIKTSNSKVEVESVKGVVDARTSNGSIQFSGRLADGDNQLRTSNAKITATLPAGSSFQLDAQTSNATIKSDFPVADDESGTRTHVRGSIGDHPTASLALHTSNGGIEIREQK